MKRQPILNVGIMTGTSIDFVLETSYHHNNNMLAKGAYTIELKGSKFILQGGDIFIITEDEIALIPIFRTNSFLLHGVTTGIQSHREIKPDQRFTGGIRFIRENGQIRVVNTIHLEDYLKSVISSEMSAHSSAELLKAHAVISRSWLLAQTEKKKLQAERSGHNISEHITEDEIIRWCDRKDHVGFDVCADDHCQRYHGITKNISTHASDAVNETIGEVLWSGDGIFDARFSQCCGGITESFENHPEALPKSYLTSVTDRKPLGTPPETDLKQEAEARHWIESTPEAFCHTKDPSILTQILPGSDQATTDFYRWQIRYEQNELAELIKQRSGYDFGQIISLEALERGFSGRITRLRITGNKRTLIVGKELEIRKWLSPTYLCSSAFVVDIEGSTDTVPMVFILKGAGWGHGMGLCQIGAAVMCEKGYSYKQILAHYYRITTLNKVY